MNLKRASSLIVILFGFMAAYSQAYLILESQGKIKPRKYPIGSTIRVHFKGEIRSSWETYTILGFDLRSKCIIVSESYCLPLIDLDGFDVTPGKGNGLEKTARKFFLQWTLFSIAQAIFRPPLTAFHFIVGGVSGLAWMYTKWLVNGQKKLNQKHRLKLIDLTLEKPRA